MSQEVDTKQKPDWFARLEYEHEQLCDKIWKLKTFLDSHTEHTKDFSIAARMLLVEQYKAMCKYRDILYVRMMLARGEAAISNEDWIKE